MFKYKHRDLDDNILALVGNIAIAVMITGFIIGLCFIAHRRNSSIEQTTKQVTAPPRPGRIVKDVHPNSPPKYKFGDRVLHKGYWELIIISDPFFEYGNDQWIYLVISSYRGSKTLENTIDDQNYSRRFTPAYENELQHKYQTPTRYNVDTIVLPGPEINNFRPPVIEFKGTSK